MWCVFQVIPEMTMSQNNIAVYCIVGHFFLEYAARDIVYRVEIAFCYKQVAQHLGQRFFERVYKCNPRRFVYNTRIATLIVTPPTTLHQTSDITTSEASEKTPASALSYALECTDRHMPMHFGQRGQSFSKFRRIKYFHRTPVLEVPY